MGYAFIKHMDSAGYNRKLFFLDEGAIDLPPIVDRTTIQPGSICECPTSGDEWVLNSRFEWNQTVVGSLPSTDVPATPIGMQYSRKATQGGPVWTPLELTVNTSLQDFAPNTIYEKHELTMYSGGLYRSNDAFTSGATFNAGDWEAIEMPVVTKVDDFIPNHNYEKHQVMTISNILYRALESFTSRATFNELDWEYVLLPVGLTYTLAEWIALTQKPELSVISNSLFDI